MKYFFKSLYSAASNKKRRRTFAVQLTGITTEIEESFSSTACSYSIEIERSLYSTIQLIDIPIEIDETLCSKR
jgi:hypothetical protein